MVSGTVSGSSFPGDVDGCGNVAVDGVVDGGGSPVGLMMSELFFLFRLPLPVPLPSSCCFCMLPLPLPLPLLPWIGWDGDNGVVDDVFDGGGSGVVDSVADVGGGAVAPTRSR